MTANITIRTIVPGLYDVDCDNRYLGIVQLQYGERFPYYVAVKAGLDNRLIGGTEREYRHLANAIGYVAEIDDREAFDVVSQNYSRIA